MREEVAKWFRGKDSDNAALEFIKAQLIAYPGDLRAVQRDRQTWLVSGWLDKEAVADGKSNP